MTGKRHKTWRSVSIGVTVLAFTFLLSSSALFTGCAKQGFPTGGPKDTTPPKSVGTKPQNESRHFHANEFYIQFDEYVVLKDADDNVLVSPPMAQKPEYTTKGKGVLVKLNDTLRPNTTYLFQFKEAIADFTEGNVLPSYEYVFSTGEGMDTLMLAGRVERSRDGKPWSEILQVLAYRPGDTVPALVTRTDKGGNYAFHYIPAGCYRLVAVEDKNKNLVVDSTEAVAWDTTYHSASDSIDSTRIAILKISAPDRRVQRVLKAEFSTKGHIVVNTLLPMRHPELEGEPHQWRLNTAGDTLHVWCLNEQCDSTVLILHDEGIDDTLKLRYRAPSRRVRGATQALKAPIVKPLCDGSKAFYDSLMLAFSAPVTATGASLLAEIMSLKDSSETLSPIVLDSSGMTARIDASLHSGEEYRIRIADSLFTDLYGHPSDSLNFKLTPKDYGILTLHIENRSGNPLVVEVLDKRDTVVRHAILALKVPSLPKEDSLAPRTVLESSHFEVSTVKFTHLPEGEYRLRAVIDTNGDGQWTTGDYRTGRQPEQSVLFGKTLSLREKWEMEEEWTIKGSD